MVLKCDILKLNLISQSVEYMYLTWVISSYPSNALLMGEKYKIEIHVALLALATCLKFGFGMLVMYWLYRLVQYDFSSWVLVQIYPRIVQ